MERNIKYTTGKTPADIKLSAIITLLFSILLLALTGCGGSGSSSTSESGGSGSVSSGVTKSATLTWEAPTTNMDGSPLTDLAGYKVYYGTTSAQYDNTVQIALTDTGLSCGFNCTYTVAGILGGNTYYFTVTAYDTSGHESLFSNEEYAYF